MADQVNQDDTLKEIEQLINDDSFFQMRPSRNEEEPSLQSVNESSPSMVTTPDPLNTAFINETENDANQKSQKSQKSVLSQQQSQTTRETASSIHALIDKVVEGRERSTIDLSTCKPTTVSRGTAPKTPIKTVSTGTMPQTPTPMIPSSAPIVIKTIDLSSVTPQTIDLVSPTVGTIDLCSPEIPATADSPTPIPQIAPPPRRS